MTETNPAYMQRCLDLARQGEYSARPNPRVGCVIVKDGQVIAEGWHQYPGHAHAEINALKQAGRDARGSTVYVSLEPCMHHGKTGPCSEALIEAGVSRVVYGMIDPYPKNAGRGVARLRAAGIDVEGPLLKDECEKLNPGFIKRMTRHLPYVRCKMAMSLDGRTAMAGGESKWITEDVARADVQHWRAASCAVLTGVQSILTDDPGMNARLEGQNYVQPLRVVLDSELRIPPTARTLGLAGPVLLATAGATAFRAPDDTAADLEIKAFPGPAGKVDLRALLGFLAQEKECNEVLVEAGPTLSGAMLQAGLVDELIVYVAPKLLGHEGLPLFRLPGLTALRDRINLEFIDILMLGKDCRMRSRVINSQA